MSISKEKVSQAVVEAKEVVAEKVTKDVAAIKEVVLETAENLEKLGKETQQKVVGVVNETQANLKVEAEQLSEQVQNEVQEVIQEPVQEIKRDASQRLEIIKKQFSTSKSDLFEFAQFLKAECGVLVKELTEVTQEIREDVVQISLKHKENLVETLKRSKANTLDVWNKVTAK